MWIYFWIGIGSALGGMARYWLSGVVAHHFGEAFPLGTLMVNVTGSLAIGFFAAIAKGRFPVEPTFSQFFVAGVCGGYTTFSSFSLQTLNLIRAGDGFFAGLNIFLSVVLCLLGVWLGHVLAISLERIP